MNRHGGRFAAMAVLGSLVLGSALQSVSAQRSPLARTSDGKPDLSGIWQALNSAAWDIEDHSPQDGMPGGAGVVEGGQIPYQPWAATKKQENFDMRATVDPEVKCDLPGVPRIMYMPYPFQIVQTPAKLTILSEYVHAVRYIYTDGTKHPQGYDTWMGDSRGRWEDDTLVVDVSNFNDKTWFDRAGNFHSNALHEIEQYSLLDADHINYQVTIEDPKVFVKPWKMSMVLYRRKEPHAQLLEYECFAYKTIGSR